MSNSRHPTTGVPNSTNPHVDAEAAEPVIRAHSIGFSSGYHWHLGANEWGVLVWASRGVITVTIDSRLWVIAPHHALWVPPRVAHAVRMSGRGTLRQVYVEPTAASAYPPLPCVLPVAPLLRELLRRSCALGTLHRNTISHDRLFSLLTDEVLQAANEDTPTHVQARELPMPTDVRARRAADVVRRDVSREQSAQTIAREAHASVRTLERLFRAQTGLSFGAWRQRARLVHAMTLLADGHSVTAVGLATGYATTSAFVAAFRRDVGVSPGRYASATQGGITHSEITPTAFRAPGPSPESPT
ncbi:MAG: helix-turn-helix transcriptional regulator [Gemmatimonadaceae bacterium]|nr:helix-turn-helix transcriptional regulator [Gemmatimonadaceae bacterium]